MEFIDDHPVVSHQVRFTSRAEISDQQAKLVRDDMVVVWLVRSRCLPPSYHPAGRDSAERYRFNVQNVEDAAPLDGDIRTQALAYLEHGPDQSFVDFGNPAVRQEDLFDAKDYGPDVAEFQIAELARYLADLGALDTELTPVENVRRLVEKLQAQEPPRPVTEADKPLVLVEDDHALVPVGPGAVERVGSIYRNGRRPASLDVLRKAFGDFD